MAEEYEEKDVYVLLDFQEKDTSRFLKQPNVYFRMLNLNEAKPIVEIEEDIYEGTYDDAVGTNVYFEEVENAPLNTNIFETQTPITLKYLLKQTKILSMRKIGTKPKLLMNAKPTETVNIRIKDDYRVLLEKFENDKLNIEEYIDDTEEDEEEEKQENPSDESEEEEEEEEQVKQWQPSQLLSRQSLVPEWYTSAQKSSTSSTNLKSQISKVKPQQETEKSAATKSMNSTYLKYVKLQKLAEQPTEHKLASEVIEGNEFEQPLHSLTKNDFIVWKNLVMQSVEQDVVNLDVNKDKIEDFVNIEKSIKAGIISPSNKNPRVFTKGEKRELLSFKNFINVSPLMKLIMLQDYLQLEKASMAQMTPEELHAVADDGCTVQERFRLIENFKEDLRSHLILRLQDEPTNDEILAEQFEQNVTLTLSDDESCYTDYSYSSDDDNDDEQPSDSKQEGEETNGDSSESDQTSELQLEEENSNLSNIDAMDVDNCSAEKSVIDANK